VSALRERLEAKTRPAATIQVAVEDTSAAAKRLDDARMARLAGLVSGGTEEENAERQAEVDAAEQALDELYVEVRLQAMAPADYEALLDAHTDEDGTLDRAAWLPPAAAASTVDTDLQDEGWWTEQLGSNRWSAGELSALFLTITRLNDPTIRSAAIPKG
jgi:hypothetical protein